MFVNGKYISKSHVMHKPGSYRTFEDAWTHKDLNKQVKGYVYAITNPAWPGWVKVGMAVDSNDRLNSYQTSSPFRDFFRERCSEHSGEWFKITREDAYISIKDLAVHLSPLESAQQLP